MKLLQGDCLDLMKDLPAGSVDMVLCDLPYGTTRNKWNTVIPLAPLWEQYKRVVKENGAIVLFAQTPFDKTLGASAIDMLRYEFIWEKDSATGFLNAKKMPLKIHENILIFYRSLPHYAPQMRKGFCPYKVKSGRGSSNYGPQTSVITENTGDRYPCSILHFKRDTPKVHPTQKPVLLLEYLIRTYTSPGELVMDNCMGSGSTGVACVNTKRDFIGMELDPGYFEAAKKRIADAAAEVFIHGLKGAQIS